jgi:hypothetical protein
MGAFESKILEMLKEATAAGNYPADFSADVKQADVPQANAIDKKWPMEAEEDDADKMVAEDDFDVDDMSDDEVVEDADADEDDEIVTEDDDKEEDDVVSEDADEDDDLDKTFSEMIARLKEAEGDPDKPEGELSEDDDNDEDDVVAEDEDKDDDEVVAESKTKKKVKESKKPVKGKKVKEDKDDMPDFLKKKLDKDGDGDPDVKEDVQPGEIGITEPEPPEPKLQVTEGDDDELTDDEKAIFGEASLPEDFRKKASVVFEAAVKARAAATRKRVAEEASKKLKEAYALLKKKSDARIAAHEAKLSEQVDRYLTYVSSQWLKENRLAVEAGIRAELAEDFLSGLKKLFVEHYIEVPQSKVDVLKVMGKKLSKLEGRLNESAKENMKLRESLTRYRRTEMVRKASTGLTATQADRLSKLAEGIAFQNSTQFASALTTLKESYFPKEKAKGTLTEQDQKKTAPKAADAEPLSEDIALYVKTLNKSQR